MIFRKFSTAIFTVVTIIASFHNSSYAAICDSKKWALISLYDCDGPPMMMTSGSSSRCLVFGFDKNGNNKWDSSDLYKLQINLNKPEDIEYSKACAEGRCDHPEKSQCFKG